MRKKLHFGLWFMAAFGLALPGVSVEAPAPPGRVEVLFSPGGGCEKRVLAELAKATRTIRLQAYTFTSPVIARALADAKARGVDCEVILDKSNRTDKFSAAPTVRAAGILCLIDEDHTVANNKVILIDDATLLTGSYNFTRAAELSNAENLLIITGMPELLKAYRENYEKHREHARPFDEPAEAAEAAASSQPAAQPVDPQPTASGRVYVTTNGKKYHRAGCEFLRGAGRAIARSEIGGKYTPCSRCRP